VYFLAEDVLDCIAKNDPTKTVWKRFVGMDIDQIRFKGERMLIGYYNRVVCVDGKGGRLNWQRKWGTGFAR